MDLSNQLMEDMDLNFEVSRLGQNLQGMFPDAGWEQSYDFSGFDPLGFADASQMLQELGQLDQLEQFLRQRPRLRRWPRSTSIRCETCSAMRAQRAWSG